MQKNQQQILYKNIKIVKLLTAIFALVLFIILLCFLDHTHFGINKKDDDTTKKKILNRIYFAMVTVSTVGYGSYSPKTINAKIIVSIFLFIMLLGLFST